VRTNLESAVNDGKVVELRIRADTEERQSRFRIFR
jgi:hypothetical protein